MRTLFILAGVLLLCIAAHGQSVGAVVDDPARRYIYSVKRFGVEDGLPDRRVLGLAQDDRGFIWAATPLGLVRYDGYEFVNHTRNEGLSNDGVSAVVRDGDGLLWVGDTDGSLDILDPRTGKARPFNDHFAGRSPEGTNGRSCCFAGSDDGTIVMAGTDELLVYRTSREGFARYPVDQPCMVEPAQVEQMGVVWGWCRTGSDFDLLRLEVPVGGDASSVPRVQRFAHALGAPRTGHDRSGLGPVGEAGTYVVQVVEEGLRCSWVSSTGEVKTFPVLAGTGPADRRGWGSLSVPLSEEMWMLGTTIRRMRSGDDPLRAPILMDLAAAYPESAFLVNDMLRDHMGAIWVSTDFGLYRILVQEELFDRMLHDSTRVRDFGKRARGMVELDGRLHVNTDHEGYWVLDARTGKVLRSDTSERFRMALISDGQGGLWRGEQGRLLHESREGSVNREVGLVHGAQLPWCGLVLGDGTMLVGTDRGLCIVDAADTATPVRHTDLDGSWFWHVARDRAGRILACTNKGVFELDDRGQVVERWWSGAHRTSDVQHLLPTDDIRHFHEDSAGVLWLSTATRGLLRWDRAAGEVRGIGQREGLPATSIHAVYGDHRGWLWMPTNNGLVRYDPASGQVKVFTTADGITFDEFNRIAHTRGPDGRLYFGGLNGITAFDPARFEMRTDTAAVPLLIKAVQVQRGSEPRPTDLTAEVLDGAPVTLRSGDRSLTVEMVLLSYDDPAQVRYAWRIDGFDTEWNIQREPVLRFTSLPFGEHVLRAKAMDADGQWTPTELRLPIRVLRPIYLRWWFIAAAVLLAGGIVYLAVRYRLRQLRQVIRVRDRIALDLHDEVGSKLSSIVLFTTALRNNSTDMSDRSVTMLKRIADNSKAAMESMNDIVWSVNSSNDQLDDVLHRMRAYAQPLCAAANIKLVIDAPQELLQRRLDMEERKSLYLVFKEAVNNAVKHAGCTHLRCSLSMDEGRLLLVVADDGKGFTAEDLSQESLGGNGLGNMRRRAQEVGGTLEVKAQPAAGTRVELRFANKYR